MRAANLVKRLLVKVLGKVKGVVAIKKIRLVSWYLVLKSGSLHC